MGIPGVQAQALQLAKSHKANYLAGGDFYVDGMNFSSRIGGRSDPTGTQERERDGKKRRTFRENPYVRAMRLIDFQISNLMRMNPQSITVVFDAMISTKKFAVRIARCETRLRKSETHMSPSALLAFRITSHYPSIRLVYSGTEAEDEIMKLIDEDETRGTRRQFVFSSDSDLFRFNIHNPAPVEIVPLIGEKLNVKKMIRTVNLQTALEAAIVPKKMRIFPPIERPGMSVINPRNMVPKFVEFVNSGIVYHRFFFSLGPMVIPGYDKTPLNVSPYRAGVEVRRAGYGHVMRKYFKDRPDVDTCRVEEWRQNGFKMEPVIVEPLEGEVLELALKALRHAPLVKVVENQLEEVAAVYAITKREISGILHMIRQLAPGQSARRPSQTADDRTYRLYIIVKAILRSVEFLDSALGIPSEVDGMSDQLSPYHIQSYLQDPASRKPVAGESKVRNSVPHESKSREAKAPQQESRAPAVNGTRTSKALARAAGPRLATKDLKSNPPTAYLSSLNLGTAYINS